MSEGGGEKPKHPAAADPPPVPAVVERAAVEGAVRQVLEKAAVPPAQAERVATQVVEVTAAMWKAPIPPPSVLAEYEDVVPGSAAQIMNVFTSEAGHRRRMERWQFGMQGAGLACGVFVVLCMLGVAAFALVMHETAVAAAVPAVLAAVAGVFVFKQAPAKKPTAPQPTLSRAERRNLARGGNRR